MLRHLSSFAELLGAPSAMSLAADELYYYWDGSTAAGWPTHDPCGSDRPNQVLGGAVPRGALWLKH